MDVSFHLWFYLFLLPFLNCVLVSGEKWDGLVVPQSDYQSLQALKHELVDSRGVLKSWNNSGISACSGWAGIKCVNGQVIAIQLPWKGLSGRISEKIGQIKSLRKLSLHDNLLVGPMPTSLGFLPNLRGVYLFNNRLSGSIPPSFGNCLFLQTLDLSNNHLTGIIPPGLANSTRLYRLNLSFNGLSGSIPVSLSQSSSLTFLALQHNNLSGSVPDLSVNDSYRLQSLGLDHNVISGKIPASLSKLTMLEELNLSHNKIEGSIPDELGSLSRLISIDLSNNAINGSLPKSLSKLSYLVAINLENNYLDSQIPEFISQLHNLSVLNLSNNKFKGRIPEIIGNITRITFLDLSKNNLTGEIPISLVNLSNLSSFNVSYNDLSGVVPSVLAKKFNSTSFVGNIQLCGYTGSIPCPSPAPENNSPSPSQMGLKHHLRKLSTKDIILIATGSLLIVLLILCCVFLCFLIRKKAASKAKKGTTGNSASSGDGGAKPVAASGTEVDSGAENGGKLVHFDGNFVFTADDLLCATAETMGKSAYGTAYKATLEDSNNTVAVKRLREKITKAQKEFELEVSALGKIRHPNILALRAYYLGPKGEKLLVYDYTPNGSLASFLHARGPETTSIPWPTRMTIAIGITRGLCFLHTEQNIIHGNLTSSNIQLDQHNNPKIAEVGLSHLTTSAANTNVIATAGTMGYRAPEFSKQKNASTKADIFSLGVIILELLTGKSPSEMKDGLDLPRWVASIVKDEWTNEVFDVELMRGVGSNNVGDELVDVLKLALHCVDPSPAARPEAQQVLQKLEEMKPEQADVTTGPVSGNDSVAVV